MAACQSKVETKVTATVDAGKVKTEIEALEQTFADAMGAKNVDAIMPYYAENAETYEGGKEPMIGKLPSKRR